MAAPMIVVRLTRPQALALCFACSNTLAEPANFESGSGHERSMGPLERAEAVLVAAVAKAERKP